MSEIHAYEARQGFLDVIAKGEAGIRLADAALQVAAEDDAIISHSTVKLPVKSFQGRISRLVADLASHHLPNKGSSNPEQQLQVCRYALKTVQLDVPVDRATTLQHSKLLQSDAHVGFGESISRQDVSLIKALPSVTEMHGAL